MSLTYPMWPCAWRSIDNDGTLDLAVASKDDNTLAWFRNVDGRGMFSAKQIVTNTAMGAYSVVAADVNLDGMLSVPSVSSFALVRAHVCLPAQVSWISC